MVHEAHGMTRIGERKRQWYGWPSCLFLFSACFRVFRGPIPALQSPLSRVSRANALPTAAVVAAAAVFAALATATVLDADGTVALWIYGVI